MKKLFSLITMTMLVMSMLPVVFATDVGIGITPDIGTEDFEPLVWGCDSRVVYDDNTEPGRITAGGEGVCTDSAGTPVAAFANNQADCLAAGSCTTIGGQTTEAACLAASMTETYESAKVKSPVPKYFPTTAILTFLTGVLIDLTKSSHFFKLDFFCFNPSFFNIFFPKSSFSKIRGTS